MLFAHAPVIIAFVTQQTPAKSTDLATSDARLQQEIPARDQEGTNFSSVIKWVKNYTKVSLSTEIDTVFLSKNSYHFGRVKAGDLMEAYSSLYKMRWVRHRDGRPDYELASGQSFFQSAYAPQDDFQRRRFEATTRFIRGFDSLPAEARNEILAGKPLHFGQLSQEMQDSITDAVEALISGNTSASSAGEKPDTGFLSRGRISIEDKSKPGSGIRELLLSVDTGVRDMSFRWNDYDKNRTKIPGGDSAESEYEPGSNNTLPRAQLLTRYPKLNTKIAVKAKPRSLSLLLQQLSVTYGNNFINDFDQSRRIVSFSCENLPLSDVMDRICTEYSTKEFGDWEWEASAGDFIVLRPKETRKQSKTVSSEAEPKKPTEKSLPSVP